MNFLSEELGKEKADGASWRCQNQKIFLTYKGHLDKIDLIDSINEVQKTKFIRCAHETGEVKGDDEKGKYEHTHCLIDFGKIFQSKNCRIFDLASIHPNIKFVTTQKHWKACLNYLGKEDPDNADLKSENNWQNVISNCKTKAEVMECIQKPTDVMGALMLYDIMKPKKEIIFKLETFRPWQQKLFDMLQEKPNDRDVNWVFDPVGKMGKSKFLKHMIANYPGKVAAFSRLGGEKDSATVLLGHLDKHDNMDTIIIDLPRSSEDHQIYGSIEAFKNGLMTATKYEGKTFFFEDVHLWIFANYLPIFESLSEDRWKIWDRDLAPLTLKRARDMKGQNDESYPKGFKPMNE